MATSILDYIFRELAVNYLGRYDLAQVQPSQSVDAMGPEPEYVAEELGEVHYVSPTALGPKAGAAGTPAIAPRPRTGRRSRDRAVTNGSRHRRQGPDRRRESARSDREGLRRRRLHAVRSVHARAQRHVPEVRQLRHDERL